MLYYNTIYGTVPCFITIQYMVRYHALLQYNTRSTEALLQIQSKSFACFHYIEQCFIQLQTNPQSNALLQYKQKIFASFYYVKWFFIKHFRCTNLSHQCCFIVTVESNYRRVIGDKRTHSPRYCLFILYQQMYLTH